MRERSSNLFENCAHFLIGVHAFQLLENSDDDLVGTQFLRQRLGYRVHLTESDDIEEISNTFSQTWCSF